MLKFRVGESVVCVDDDFRRARAYARRQGVAGIAYPERGKCYVVRGYAWTGRWPAVLLTQITNPPIRYLSGVPREAGFWDERFERAPRIDQLRELIKDADVDAVSREKEDA